MQKPFFRGPFGSGRVLRSDAAPVFLTLTAASLLLIGVASADNAPKAPKGQSAPAPVPVAPAPVVPKKGVNVLIVAIDDEGSLLPSISVGTATAPAAPRISPDVPLTGVTPTEFGVLQSSRPQWLALADKKKKGKNEPSFLPLPEPPGSVQPFPAPMVGPGVGQISPQNPINGNKPNFAPLPDTSPGSLAAPLSVLTSGRSYLAALSLARALSALGYGDTQATPLDGTILARALGEKRLAPEVMPALLSSMKALQSAAGLPEGVRKASLDLATTRANNAAAAIGQATGYRAVVGLYVGPFADGASPYAVVLSDSTRETGEPIIWSETARDESTARDTGATTGAALLDRALTNWTPNGPADTRALADAHFAKARAAGTDLVTAQNEITRVIALDPNRSDAYLLLGDLLSATDLNAAANAYRRASELSPKDGKIFEKMTIAYANAPVPDWPRALDAGQKAITNGVDTAPLRVAMAKAQFGRADLFHNANRDYRADDANDEAQKHLERALQLAPDNPDALRLMARSYTISGRTTEAVQTLGRILPLYPKDPELQRQYAQALMTLGDRKGDAFAAYAKLWKMTADTNPIVDDITYSALTEGFDERVYNLGRSANQIALGVASGNIARESAYLQLARLKSDMSDAEDAINILNPPAGFATTAVSSRQFAASLMNQTLEENQKFLDSGQDTYRTRAGELYRQAVAQLNEARNAT